MSESECVESIFTIEFNKNWTKRHGKITRLKINRLVLALLRETTRIVQGIPHLIRNVTLATI